MVALQSIPIFPPDIRLHSLQSLLNISLPADMKSRLFMARDADGDFKKGKQEVVPFPIPSPR